MCLVVSQKFCVPSRNFAFSSQNHRNVVFPPTSYYFQHQFLGRNTKLLRSDAKFLEGEEKKKFCKLMQSFWGEHNTSVSEICVIIVRRVNCWCGHERSDLFYIFSALFPKQITSEWSELCGHCHGIIINRPSVDVVPFRTKAWRFVCRSSELMVYLQ